MRELEFAQHIRSPVTASKHHQGLYGLREECLIEDLINMEFNKQKIYLHPISHREETPVEREQRMILYDMIVTSLVHFKIMYSAEAVGDNYVILRNVMRYGAPNFMRMRIDLTTRLGNYSKKEEQGYQEYELGLRDLIDQLVAVGHPVSTEDTVMR